MKTKNYTDPELKLEIGDFSVSHGSSLRYKYESEIERLEIHVGGGSSIHHEFKFLRFYHRIGMVKFNIAIADDREELYSKFRELSKNLRFETNPSMKELLDLLEALTLLIVDKIGLARIISISNLIGQAMGRNDIRSQISDVLEHEFIA